jgi:hypothetical protein
MTAVVSPSSALRPGDRVFGVASREVDRGPAALAVRERQVIPYVVWDRVAENRSVRLVLYPIGAVPCIIRQRPQP